MSGIIIFWLVIVMVAALLFWVLGSIALRLIGFLATAGGLLNLLLMTGATGTFTLSSAAASLLGGLVIGPLLWIAGHWLFALKHHHFKSPLAQRAIQQPFHGRLDPTHNWGIRTFNQ
jgi:glucose-6-phosphate-specific signal transduction histidine kinase